MDIPKEAVVLQLEDGGEIYVCPFGMMGEMAQAFHMGMDVLEEGKRFGYMGCDVYEGCICLGMEQLQVSSVLHSENRMVAYWENSFVVLFTCHMELVLKFMEGLREKLGERVTLHRMVHGFLEFLTKEDDVVLAGIEGETIALEQRLIMVQDEDCVEEIVDLRKRLLILKRYYEQSILVLESILEDENEWLDAKELASFRLLKKRTERKLRNVMDLRELVTQVRETYEAEVEISLNQTMKRFTGLTSIFFPLTLIVGWYGMNLELPEYDWAWGYPFVVGLSLGFTIVGILYFRKKKWF